MTDYEIWKNNPEKVFGVNLEWAEKYPTRTRPVKALIEAAAWADKPENRKEVVRSSRPSPTSTRRGVVDNSMTGTWRYSKTRRRSLPDFNVFYRYAATYPWLSHAAWYITQMSAGASSTPRSTSEDRRVDLPARHLPQVAKELGLPTPSRLETEGFNKGPGRSSRRPARSRWVRTRSSTA